MNIPILLRRLVFGDEGQDLIEYGLLAAIIAIAGVLLIPGIVNSMGIAFDGWGQATYDAWDPDPAP